MESNKNVLGINGVDSFRFFRSSFLLIFDGNRQIISSPYESVDVWNQFCLQQSANIFCCELSAIILGCENIGLEKGDTLSTRPEWIA